MEREILLDFTVAELLEQKARFLKRNQGINSFLNMSDMKEYELLISNENVALSKEIQNLKHISQELTQ